jgi:hypothetical protein
MDHHDTQKETQISLDGSSFWVGWGSAEAEFFDPRRHSAKDQRKREGIGFFGFLRLLCYLLKRVPPDVIVLLCYCPLVAERQCVFVLSCRLVWTIPPPSVCGRLSFVDRTAAWRGGRYHYFGRHYYYYHYHYYYYF